MKGSKDQKENIPDTRPPPSIVEEGNLSEISEEQSRRSDLKSQLAGHQDERNVFSEGLKGPLVSVKDDVSEKKMQERPATRRSRERSSETFHLESLHTSLDESPGRKGRKSICLRKGLHSSLEFKG